MLNHGINILFGLFTHQNKSEWTDYMFANESEESLRA